mgnify:CR=1 FL=1
MDEHKTLDALVIEGKSKLEASVSMLYTDILSQELNASLGSPDAVALIQKHFQHQRLENLRQQDIAPLIDSVPESFFDIVKEATFSTGALSKEVTCLRELRVGQPFAIKKSGIMGTITMKDARVMAIDPLAYKPTFEG